MAGDFVSIDGDAARRVLAVVREMGPLAAFRHLIEQNDALIKSPELDNGRAIVRVSDDGPGIDSAFGAAVFDPLRSTKSRGLGIGLSIARALARAMKGELVLEDGPGTSFRLELEEEPR